MSEQKASTLLARASAPAPRHGVLRRSCACGAQSHGEAECASCAKKHHVLQRKLAIGASHDPLEIEADRVADQALALPEHAAPPKIQRSAARDDDSAETAPDSVERAIAQAGRPLDHPVRRDMEQRFGRDFSQVRVHTGQDAAQSADDVRASAYTIGQNVVFGAGRFAPATTDGRRLLAHELAHVVQQSDPRPARHAHASRGAGGSAHAARNTAGVVRRCINPAKNDPLYDAFAKGVKNTAAYKALADKTLADSIIVDAKKKAGCLYYIGKLRDLFDMKEKPPATISVETQATTVTEAAKEQTRVAKPAEKKNLDVEEKASADPKRTWVKIKGKFGGGTYEVDRTDPKNIVVRAKVFLKTAGTGTAADIANIKQMEDAIEKAASTKGFTVDITFVNAPDKETFTASVDPSRWEDAENWSGGEPRGFAHELLHMFAFELDRYDYIVSHAQNDAMTVPNRLIWFSKQLTKPAGWDNAASLMGYGGHPLDDDVCRVAGLDIAACVATRTSTKKTP
jgi:uncharacterized protein DUF4157